MKIFNWVHRKFNSKAEDAKKNDDCVDIGGDDQQNKCNHVFERWRGGILAIGTLGYDPLKDEKQQLDDCFFHDGGVVSSGTDHRQYYYYDDEDDDVDETSENSDEEEEEVESDEEEVNPLVVAADSCDNAEEECAGAEMEENWSHEFEYVMMKKKERTTLADLFYADSHDRDAIEKKQMTNKADSIKEKSNRKQRVLFRNKLIANDARPIYKLNQLMRRMLKRKIHPEVGPANSKVAARENDDYASLLPTQDANI